MRNTTFLSLLVAMFATTTAQATTENWWAEFGQPNPTGGMSFLLMPKPGTDPSSFHSAFLWSTGAGVVSNDDIAKVGLAGPSGWPGTQVADFNGTFPVVISTGWEPWSSGHFRGVPYAVSKSGEVGYLDLGPPSSPTLKCWFGSNTDLVVDDGSGNSIIDFGLNDYIVGYHLAKTILGQGLVNGGDEALVYPVGATVALSAVPAQGWHFVGWQQTLLTKAVSPFLDLTMDANKSIVAVFERDDVPPPPPPSGRDADIDDNGRLDAADVQLVIRAVLGLPI
ncbi:MAG: hypothetical protein WCV92_02905 [Candidatus Buchananbacteria bacterium]